MTQDTPIGSAWYNEQWDAEMTVESETGIDNEFIQVSYDGSGIIEDEFTRTSWDFERVE